MGRRIFISYEGHDRNRAKGFNLMSYNRNVNLEFVGRHLLDPVKSEHPDYIERKIKEQIAGSSVTVVLIGQHTTESRWVAKEVEWSLMKDPPNGILGIRLKGGGVVPEALEHCGAEVIDWNPTKFADAIERAARQTGRVLALAGVGSTSGRGCAR